MFFVHVKKKKKKKNEKSYNGNVLTTNVPTNRFRCVCVYLQELVYEQKLAYLGLFEKLFLRTKSTKSTKSTKMQLSKSTKRK